MKKLSILLIPLLFLLFGCSTFQSKQSIDQFTKDYETNSESVRKLAKVTSKDWVLGAGLIMGSLSQDQMPIWVYEELMTVTEWFMADGKYNSDTELNDYQLGYIVGLRFRLFGPIVKAFIEIYMPNLLQVAEVASFLLFFGI